jgi:hypothetical protein
MGNLTLWLVRLLRRSRRYASSESIRASASRILGGSSRRLERTPAGSHVCSSTNSRNPATRHEIEDE